MVKLSNTVGAAVFAALLATSALAQSSDPRAAGRGFIATDLVQGRWVVAIDPDRSLMRAGIVAQSVDPSLETGVLEYDCHQGPEGPRQRFTVRYWQQGGLTDEFEFALNLFDSAGSMRPAGYDFGDGLVSTAHIRNDGPLSDPAPDLYTSEVAEFRDRLAATTRGTLTVIFLNPRGVAPVGTLVFPVAGFGEAIKGQTEFCPA